MLRVLQVQVPSMHRLVLCTRQLSATATGPLAGPSATQMLADMGAEVIKVEQPKSGDDTRRYAPPYLQKKQNCESDSEVAAYYASCNRNKYSVAVDFKKKEGQEVVKQLLEGADVLIENFKAGGLAKYGLSFDHLKEEYPGALLSCSLSRSLSFRSPAARFDSFSFVRVSFVSRASFGVLDSARSRVFPSLDSFPSFPSLPSLCSFNSLAGRSPPP